MTTIIITTYWSFLNIVILCLISSKLPPHFPFWIIPEPLFLILGFGCIVFGKVEIIPWSNAKAHACLHHAFAKYDV